MDIFKKFLTNIERRELFKRGDALIVGVSGGPDSTALLYLLREIQAAWGLRLIAAHFNHRLRKNAIEDQRFVERLASSLRLPYCGGQWRHPKKIAKGSVEELARDQRFRFLIQTAKKYRAKAVALAHHQDDVAETVLMRILRGSGLQGLRAIVPMTTREGIDVIRPLWNIPKKDLLDFLKKHGIAFRRDPTNARTKFFRNKIRLKLLPLLEREYQSNIREVLAGLADAAGVDYAYLAEQTQKIFPKSARGARNKKSIRLDLKKFCRQEEAIQRMLFRQACQSVRGNTRRLTLSHWEEIRDLLKHRPAGSVVDLPERLQAKKTARDLVVSGRE